jgi:PAS domain S-box-containing protein
MNGAGAENRPRTKAADECRQADVALLETRALQSAIFNSRNFSSIATDADGVIQIFNVGAERMLGYSAADVVNRITPADISDPQELIARATALSTELGTSISPGFEALVFKASRGIEDIYELTYIRKDGTRFPAMVSVTALQDASDTVIGYLLIGTDNTARHRVEEERQRGEAALRVSEVRYRALFECAPDGIVIADVDSYYLDGNGSICRMLGYTRDELIGLHASDIVTDSELPNTKAALGTINTGSDYHQEWQFKRKDGSVFDAEVIATTLPDGNLLGMIRDITDRRRADTQTANALRELETASRMKSEFLANMSHELRTPLNAIIGFSEVLKDGLIGELTEPQRRFIGDIFGSGTHLLSLINDILDLSKVEAGKMELEIEPMYVSSLLANGLSIIREKAAARQIRLHMNANELGFIEADARKVKQIVYNLLSNAVKFTNQSGRVTLHARYVPRATVGRLSGSRSGRVFPLADNGFAEFLEVGVTDTGIGISPEGLEQLFTPFHQIDSGLARKFEGTGLGLAMVKLLAELHGGSVSVESAVNEGSCFTVWLPVRGGSGEYTVMHANGSLATQAVH